MDQNDHSGRPFDQVDEQIQEQLTGYAMDALEPDETRAIDAYLQANPEATVQVQRLEEALTSFAYAAPQIAPPASAKANLLARVHADAETVIARDPAQSPAPDVALQSDFMGTSTPESLAAEFTAPHSSPDGSSSQPGTFPFSRQGGRGRAQLFDEWREQRWRWSFDHWFDFATGWKVATVASAVALLFFTITTLQLTGQLAGLAATLDESAAQVAELEQVVTLLQAENRQLGQTNQEMATELASLLTVNQVIELGGTEVAPDARGTLFVGTDSLVLVLHGLQPLSADQTYQLWLIPEEANPVSAGLVQISNPTTPLLTAEISLATQTFATVGLSIEPSGGSPQPTGSIVILGQRT